MMMSKVEKKKLNGCSCIAVASSTAIKSKQTGQSLLLVPSIRKMSNTNNHDGLILTIARWLYLQYDHTTIDTRHKSSIKIASHFSVLKVPSVIKENDDKDERNEQPTIANK